MNFRLQSTNLQAADYNPLTATLVITFRSRAVYAYSRVPLATVYGLLRAESHGRYFHRHIRNEFPCRRLQR